MQKRFVLYFILVLSIFHLLAFIPASAENRYRFHTFSPEGGFYYDGVTNIKQDLDGFLWIMMSKNLYRFDGYKYKHYYGSFEEAESEKLFSGMVVDHSGRLFVAVANGLYLYNKTTDSFSKIYSGTRPSYLVVDKENTLWFMDNQKFGSFDEKSRKINTLTYNNQPLPYIFGFTADDNGFFLLAGDKTIFRYNNTTKSVNPFFTAESGVVIRDICKIDNILWFITEDSQFYKIDISTGKLIGKIPLLTDNKTIVSRTIYADRNKNIWISSLNGLYVFHTKTNNLQHYIHSKSDIFSIPNNSVWVIDEDLQKNVWIGTYSGGLAYVNLDDKDNFSFVAPETKGLNHNVVSAFAEDKDRLWIATEGEGLNSMDKKTKQFSYYLRNSSPNSLPSNNVKSIVLDSDQNLWLATFRGGLSHFNPSKNKFTNFSHDPNNPNSLRSDNLRKLVLEPNSGIWIAYQLPQQVISFYSFEKKTFTHYTFDKDDGHYIFDIFLAGGNKLWIVTHKKLYSLNTKSGEIRKLEYDQHYLEGQALCVDGKENVWIGTIGRGLILYDSKKNEFTPFTDILKFNVSSIFSICTDFEDNLWLGTDNGLIKFDTNSHTFFRFDRRDGVLCQVFQPLSSYVNMEGKIYFGCTNGFAVVNSTNVEKNHFNPQVMISDFYVDNTSAVPRTKNPNLLENIVSFPEKIELTHHQSNFGFTFSSNNYLVPEKNRFRYRLKGYDSRWIEVDAQNRSVFYSKVPAGSYVFEVMASNNDGVWSNEVKQIQIKRLPPLWLTWWAYLIYFLLGLTLLYVVFRYYQNHRKLKLQLYLDQLDKEKKEAIHQSQLRFFTNISHDFRTPLSLIIASVEKLRREGLKEYYYRILNGNTQHLLGLVNELMDFRTVENGNMPLKVSPVNVNSYVENLAFDFDDYAKQRDISFEIKLDEKLADEILADKNIVEKITMNLLNNAFRYTQNGGKIVIQTLASASDFKSIYQNNYTVSDGIDRSDYFAIVVSDSGVGISKESIASVFERFYKTDTVNFDLHLGTGIGLALVKSLVLLHKGSITIFSERDKGSDFIVALPKSPMAYSYTEKEQKGGEEAPMKRREILEVTTEELLVEKPEELKILSHEEEYKEKKTILVVEDNEDLRNLVIDYLSSDYDVLGAENGVVASAILEETNVELIISDIMMPLKDGITLCKEVKNDINTSHIPFLLLTAKSGLESKIEGADSGADFYFEKPIDFNLLLLNIKNIFQQQQKMREFYSKNYFADSYKLTKNQRDVDFIKQFVEVIDSRIDQSKIDVNSLAYEMSMSRSKLYNKIKGITGKSIVEFILTHRLRIAARLIVETDLSMREIMDQIGIESQSYFTHSFKDEFGDTPTAFAAKHKKA